MRGELVAIDLETTGLNDETDAIIEVGAVRLKEGMISAEYTTLVNPGRPIPPYVTHLTGIRTEDVLGSPPIATVLPEIKQFIGDAPIVGHNIGFDLGFLYRQGILRNNLRIDTYDLASVLLPRAPRYNLSSLTSQMNVQLDNAHRALHDARAAALLYWELWKKALLLPYETLQEITLAAQGFDWDARAVFEAALHETRPQGGFQGTDDKALIELFGSYRDTGRTLADNGDAVPVSISPASEYFGESGLLAQRMPGYEQRDQQLHMADAVMNAFSQSRHMMIEAGTGTGKSLAYLVPAIIWSLAKHERVVISTNTINLQEQLIDKDIPSLHTALDLPFTATVLKGRGNYLCPRRLAAVRRRHPTHVDELRTLAKILVWLLESTSGDRGEINLRGPVENNTWQRLSAEDEDCSMDRCQAMMRGACPFYKARKAAEAANLLVVNHALLLSDALMENHVLPDYRYLILDEAHHLEEATTSSLTFRLDEDTLRRRLADLGGQTSGLLGDLLSHLRGRISEKQYSKIATFVAHISSATSAMETHIRALFNAYREFFGEVSNSTSSSDYVSQLRITQQHRAHASFAQCQLIWTTLQEFFDGLSQAMHRLTEAVARFEQSSNPDLSDLVNSTSAAARYLDEIKAQLTGFTLMPAENTVYWMSMGQNPNQLTVNSAPLHVGPMVEKHLWSAKQSVVMTSATLQTNKRFDFVRQRLFADSVETLDVGTPFNYRESTLVFIPNDMPEPSDQQHYQQALERGLIELATALDGRVLALFTSYTQLRQTAQAIRNRLEVLGNISVYDQSEGSSRQALLDGFKTTEKAVLLGTKSFWEGVDIPGSALSALVIARLPFAVPTEPVFASRYDTYADGFREFALPDAILRFRQGFGRLIRTRTDRGIVTIFDRRITSKGYGANFLDALPDCTIQYGALRDLPQAAKNWLSQSKS